jgi:2-polyprenyl-3-methyl-5-hydroxy-6-metoxy-1,4-benzoquinol methylase
MKKNTILYILNIISFFWKLIPNIFRGFLIRFVLAIESRGNPKKSLKFLFQIQDYLEQFINQSALRYEGKHHPKHRLTSYHNYFISNIEDNSRVLDLGCGYGYVTFKIAEKKLHSKITGMERVAEKVNFASKEYNLPNLDFILGDILNYEFKIDYDIIILSNIIEHIDDRVDFLKKIVLKCKPKKIIFRVPDFRRSWQMSLKKEIGANYFSDIEHFIEPTYEEFENELKTAGLKIVNHKIIWGEIWCSTEII